MFEFLDLIGKNPNYLKALELAERVADKDISVLINGPPGTGKTKFARMIHSLSHRRNQNFVRVNATTVNDNLAEASWVGHNRGAFTGAYLDIKGKFELVDKGTLFIDNINLMSKPLQVSLLMVLEEGEFEKLGTENTQKTNFRLITAANENLKALTESNNFRRDLYNRICVVEIDLPPLKSRKDDIHLLADHFVKFYCNKYGLEAKELTSDVLAKFLAYPWPGNVRELENVCERAVVLSQKDSIYVGDLPSEITEPDRLSCSENVREHLLKLILDHGFTLKAIEEMLIEELFKKFEGNKSSASMALGMNRITFTRRIKELGLQSLSGQNEHSC